MTSGSTRIRHLFWPSLICGLSGAAIFQFIGNSTRSYIGSASLFYWWGFQWVNPRSETQHGLLIFGISIFLVVRNLRIQGSALDGWRLGLGAAVGAMIGGLLVHAVGFVAEQARVSIFGLMLFAWGFASFAGGRRWARATAFPTAFLVFAIPLNALDSAGFWLRMWVVDGSARLIHGLGIGVIVNGTQLLSPDGRYDYDVAAACSGVRSLVALSALSLLIGYLRFRTGWLWALFFALSFPLIFVGNVLRIVAIVVAAQHWGQSWGDRVHEIMGYGVFGVVLGGVILAAEVAGRLWPGQLNQPPETKPKEALGAREIGSDLPSKLPGPWPATFGVASFAIIVATFLTHVAGLPARGRAGIALNPSGLAPVELPEFLGTEWIGRSTDVTEIERELLPVDTGFSRKIYVSVADPSKQAFFSIVLSGHDRTSIHRPELCLVGQGWTILGSFAHRFEFPGRTAGFPSTVLRVEKVVSSPSGKVAVPQLVAYYFVGGDVVVASHWDRLVLDAWNRVVHGRADRWAYVLIQTGEPDGEADALQRIQEILDGTLPAFQRVN
jgi:exosortase